MSRVQFKAPMFCHPPLAGCRRAPRHLPDVSFIIVNREQRPRADKAMIKSWVKINGPKDRDVFVDYDFTAPAGRTNEPFQVHSGTNTFMLLSPNLIIEARARANVHALDKSNPQVIELWPAPVNTAAASSTRPAARP